MIIFCIAYVCEYFLYMNLKELNFSSCVYFKQEGELGTVGILFCVKPENNYILKLRFMKHFF